MESEVALLPPVFIGCPPPHLAELKWTGASKPPEDKAADDYRILPLSIIIVQKTSIAFFLQLPVVATIPAGLEIIGELPEDMSQATFFRRCEVLEAACKDLHSP